MNRQLVKHDSNEIRNLKAHIKKLNDHLKVGEELYNKHKKKTPKNILLEHKKKVNNLKKQRNFYMNRLNNRIRELQPSTSGRK